LKRQSTAYRYVSTGSYIANNIDRISALGANWTRAVGGNDVNDPQRSSGRIRRMVRFLRRHGCSQGQALTLGGVAETFVALNRGPRVEPMDI